MYLWYSFSVLALSLHEHIVPILPYLVTALQHAQHAQQA